MCSGADLARRRISVGFPGQMVEEGQHVCYIYNDDAERRRGRGEIYRKRPPGQ